MICTQSSSLEVRTTPKVCRARFDRHDVLLAGYNNDINENKDTIADAAAFGVTCTFGL